MARQAEQVGDWIVNSDEAQYVTGGFEPLHDPLTPPRRLMRILRPIVEPFVLAMLDREPGTPARSAIGTELVGDQDTRSASLSADELAHQPLGGMLVTTALDQSIQRETVLIDGTPEPVLVAADRDDDLIQVLFVAELGRAPADRPDKIPSEFLGPAPDGLMADDDAPGGQQAFDHAQAEWKAENRARQPEKSPRLGNDDHDRGNGKPHSSAMNCPKTDAGVNVTVPAQ